MMIKVGLVLVMAVYLLAFLKAASAIAKVDPRKDD